MIEIPFYDETHLNVKKWCTVKNEKLGKSSRDKSKGFGCELLFSMKVSFVSKVPKCRR